MRLLDQSKYNNAGAHRCHTSDDSQEEESDFGNARAYPLGHLSTLEEQYESGTTLPPQPRFADHRVSTSGQASTLAPSTKNVPQARASSMLQPQMESSRA